MRISKAVVVGVVLAFVAAIGAIAFLLGRESGRAQMSERAVVIPEVQQPPNPQPQPDPNPPPQPDPNPPPQPNPNPNPQPNPNPPPNPNPSLTPSPSPSPSPSPPPSAEALAVRDYFAQMSAIQASGLAGDPNDVAQKLLASSMAGDSSGFDDIIRAAAEGEAKARAVQAPSVCADHHAKTLAFLHDGVALTRSLKSALERQDATGLTSLAASASGLQSRADNLMEEERTIKARFGLSP
jgi:hypothetical protein